MRTKLASIVALFIASVAFGQEKPPAKPGDAMIEAYLAAETDKLSQKFLDGAKTLDEWKAKRPRLHREYLDMLGLQPLPEKTPLKATITRTFENQGAEIDNLHFQSKPGLYVTANLYRPKGNTKKLPTILYVCGHANKGRDGNKSAYQDHGLWFANNGYNCLILDTLQLGEIPGIHHGTYNKDRWWWHSAGYTPAGVEAWNGIRAIDYLLTRSDVDADKLAVTGISGGGAATIWIAAADDRVKVAVPVSGMSDLESYVKNKVINGHCDCMFLYNTHQWEWTTILALIAPRPLLFANSDNDPIFPMDANRRIAARMRTIYGLYGKESLTDEYVSPGGHAYRPDLRVAIFKFLNKHVKGDTMTAVEDVKFEVIPGKELRVFPTDDDLPKDILNGKIDETFVPRGKLELPAAANFAKWRDAKIAEIREKCFRPLPATIPPVKGDDYSAKQTESGITCSTGVSGAKADFASATLIVNHELGDTTDGRSGLDGRHYWLKTRGRTQPWTKKSPPNTVERSHMLLGRTVAQGEVRDVLAMLPTVDPDGHPARFRRVYGQGESGIIAAYAALFDPSVSQVVLASPPTSHLAGPHFPGILRILDIPDALGLLAPRPLTIIGDDPAFDRTAEIYRLAGAADKLKRVKK